MTSRFVMSTVKFFENDLGHDVFFTVFSPVEFSEEDIHDCVSKALFECANQRVALKKQHASFFDLQRTFQEQMGHFGLHAHAAHEQAHHAIEHSMNLH